jgi:hypothetical protein
MQSDCVRMTGCRGSAAGFGVDTVGSGLTVTA